jgi:hypothetical protein
MAPVILDVIQLDQQVDHGGAPGIADDVDDGRRCSVVEKTDGREVAEIATPMPRTKADGPGSLGRLHRAVTRPRVGASTLSGRALV